MEELTIHQPIFSQTLWKDCHGILLGECHGPTYRTLRITALKPLMNFPSQPFPERAAQETLTMRLLHSTFFPWCPMLSCFHSTLDSLRFVSPLSISKLHLTTPVATNFPYAPYEAPIELLFWQHGSSRNRHVNKIPSSNLEINLLKDTGSKEHFKPIRALSSSQFPVNFLYNLGWLVQLMKGPLLSGSHHDISNRMPRWDDSFLPFISNFLELLKVDAMSLLHRTLYRP